jgi:hypothetical protein
MVEIAEFNIAGARVTIERQANSDKWSGITIKIDQAAKGHQTISKYIKAALETYMSNERYGKDHIGIETMRHMDEVWLSSERYFKGPDFGHQVNHIQIPQEALINYTYEALTNLQKHLPTLEKLKHADSDVVLRKATKATNNYIESPSTVSGIVSSAVKAAYGINIDQPMSAEEDAIVSAAYTEAALNMMRHSKLNDEQFERRTKDTSGLKEATEKWAQQQMMGPAQTKETLRKAVSILDKHIGRSVS